MKVSLSAYTSRKIARLGLLCAMMVVFIHSYLVVGSVGNLSAVAAISQEFISQALTRIAVPYFFLVSGFFLYRDFDFSFGWFVAKMHERIRTLAVPYVIWGVIAMLFTLCCSFVARKLSEAPIDFASISWWLKVLGVTQKPLYVGQLWFVRMIMEWLCLAPFVGWAVRRWGYAVPVVCLVVQCVPCLANPWANALLFISSGAALALMQSERRRQLLAFASKRLIIYISLLSWFVMLVVRTYWALSYGGDPYLWNCRIGGVVVPYELAMNCVGLVAVWLGYDLVASVRLWMALDSVCGASFFIYCSHNIYLALLRSPLRRTPIWNCDLLHYALPPILAIALTCLSWKLLGWFLPDLRRLLCGGRG